MREMSEGEDGPRGARVKQSRRKRFHDPDNKFGKNSLVYRLKFGDLKDKAEALLAKKTGEQQARQVQSGREVGTSGDRWEHPRRPIRERGPRRYRGGTLSSEQYGPLVDESHEAPTGFLSRGRARQQGIINMPYTTAASQFLYGKSVVKAALLSDRRQLYKLYILEGPSRAPATDPIWQLAKNRKLSVQSVKERQIVMLQKMSEGRPHNGYVLEASPLRQLPINHLNPLGPNPWDPFFTVDIARQSKEETAINGSEDIITYPARPQKPLVLFLHEVTDPQNLGALIRSAKFLGVTAVVVTKENSAPLSSAALKASAGAAEEMPVLVAQDGRAFLEESRKSGWRSFAAVAPPSSAKEESKAKSMVMVEKENPLANDPCILVVANEGKGLPRAVRAVCDEEVFIPGGSLESALDSLNVSVAGGILCHAFLRDRPRSNDTKAQAESAPMKRPEAVNDQLF
jgi:21S rRNA (GM2251-2'-O)-methyltransferase